MMDWFSGEITPACLGLCLHFKCSPAAYSQVDGKDQGGNGIKEAL